MLPGTVRRRLWKRSDHSAVLLRIARLNTVMLTIECSKPAAMNAKRHHQMRTSLAESLLVREAIHSARQTSMLQSTARQKSCPLVAWILPVTAEVMKAKPGAMAPGFGLAASTPLSYTIQAKTKEPTKLPTRAAIQTATSSYTLQV